MSTGALSDDLIYRANGDLKTIAEPAGGGAYYCYNFGGVEMEVGEFLYGLVRMLKPDKILETGTHWGISAMYMAQALKDNRRGMLTTIEFAKENVHKAGNLFNILALEPWIEQFEGPVESFEPKDNQYDLIFLDTEPFLRFGELVRFWPNLKAGGFVGMHDLDIHMEQWGNPSERPWCPLPDEIKQLIKNHELQSFHFHTPRGLYLGQKYAKTFYSNELLKGEMP